ncbi:MAG TPA: hypothetical protein VK249_31865 [Anaerolineales bacterium]|nr:hypothetical protein [Anaerolineales bacterium]
MAVPLLTYPQGRFAYPQGRFAYNRRMLRPFHIEMMHLALGEEFSARALEGIIAANLYQDRLRGQIGHDEYHCDNNALEKSYAYIEEQRALTISALAAKDVLSAWAAFGKLTHTAQDFYAHSNYIDLWLACQPKDALPAPSEVDPLDPDLINAQDLRSGKVYLLELLTIIPGLKPLVVPLLPRDAHAWMNLDSPARGPNFQYAFQAAVKRTKIEFGKTTKDLPGDLFAVFVDK